MDTSEFSNILYTALLTEFSAEIESNSLRMNPGTISRIIGVMKDMDYIVVNRNADIDVNVSSALTETIRQWVTLNDPESIDNLDIEVVVPAEQIIMSLKNHNIMVIPGDNVVE